MSTWFVTISALRRFAKDAKQAEAKLNEANETMKSAAAELCSNWQGDAATAFSEEQNKVHGWVTDVIRIGSYYISTVLKAAETYEQKEQELSGKVSG